MEELTALPGIGRKTANLILGDVYGQPAYVCDTHCIRITGRLGLTDGSKDPLSVEKQLRAILPPEESNDFCHRLVLFGRDRCTARKANCDGCPLRKDCDYGKAQKIISSQKRLCRLLGRRPRCAPCLAANMAARHTLRERCFHHVHAAAKNDLILFRACGHETLRGFPQ